MTNHALLSPSGAHRWMNCPASVAMEAVLKKMGGVKDESSQDSREGTAAHILGETVLNQHETSTEHLPVSHYFGETIVVEGQRFEVNQEMVDAIEMYIEYIESIPHEKTFIETKIDYSHLVKDGFGTADCIFEGVEKIGDKPIKTLWVVDLKYGFKRVSSWENPQGKLYASGALKTLKNYLSKDLKRVIITIVQPRLKSISEFEISVKDLIKWGEKEVKPKAKLALGLYHFAKDARPIPNEDGHYDLVLKPDMFNPAQKTCEWCNAKGQCKAQAKKALSIAVEGFEDLTTLKQNNIAEAIKPSNADSKPPLKNPLHLSNADLSGLWQLKGFIQDWLTAIEDICLEKIMKGETIPGLKQVQTFKNKTWSLSKAELEDRLKKEGLAFSEFTETNIKSPSKIEKELKKKFQNWKARFKHLSEDAIHRPLGSMRLTFETDSRPSAALPISDEINLGLDDNSVNSDFDFLGPPIDTEKDEEWDFLN